MLAKGLTPILNVSDIQQSFAWFEKLGWQKSWDWGSPPTFGAVCSGDCTIFLCLNGQGSRGKSAVTMTFGRDGNDAADQGAWMSIWVDDVDTVHRQCLEQGLEVTWPPTDMPWNVREMHVRHPDGHVFRISRGIEEEEEIMPPRRVDVFFYGLFMDPDLLRAKGVTPENVELATVTGFTLRIGERAALVPHEPSRVYGVVMSLALADLARLYSEPTLQAYQPQAVLASLASGGVVAALCYNLPEAPSPTERNPEYAIKLRSVGQKVGLPAEYVASMQ